MLVRADSQAAQAVQHLDVSAALTVVACSGGLGWRVVALAEDPATAAGVRPLIGTRAYLAPERIDGAPATPPSNLYSLGIDAWECLTARRSPEPDGRQRWRAGTGRTCRYA